MEPEIILSVQKGKVTVVAKQGDQEIDITSLFLSDLKTELVISKEGNHLIVDCGVKMITA